jgi:hypothetical protein
VDFLHHIKGQIRRINNRIVQPSAETCSLSPANRKKNESREDVIPERFRWRLNGSTFI